MYYRDENGNWEEIILEPSGDTLPIGAITQFSGETAPTNWLLCNGQAISRTDYAELFDVIGTTYGIGDGSSTFNLPDLRGRVPVGLKSSDASFDALGKTGGEKNHTLTIAEMPLHYHEFDRTKDATRLVYQNGDVPFNDGSQGSASAGNTNSVGGGQAHNNLQPYIVTNYIIKAKQSIGIVGTVTNDITDSNNDAVPNCKTVKDYVDEKQTYSTTETVVGTWLGKPLYRKVIDFGSLPNTENKYVTHNINIETPVRCSGIVLNPNTGMKFTMPMPDINIWLDINQVCVRTGSDRSATTGIAIIEYTKTTD